MLPRLQFDEGLEAPIYRQICDQIREAILRGPLEPGERLPATRTLADQLGLNRQTVSSAYELLENEGFIKGQVGRGSFVTLPNDPRKIDWNSILEAEPRHAAPPSAADSTISLPPPAPANFSSPWMNSAPPATKSSMSQPPPPFSNLEPPPAIALSAVISSPTMLLIQPTTSSSLTASSKPSTFFNASSAPTLADPSSLRIPSTRPQKHLLHRRNSRHRRACRNRRNRPRCPCPSPPS